MKNKNKCRYCSKYHVPDLVQKINQSENTIHLLEGFVYACPRVLVRERLHQILCAEHDRFTTLKSCLKHRNIPSPIMQQIEIACQRIKAKSDEDRP